jgi:hypothetical protein
MIIKKNSFLCQQQQKVIAKPVLDANEKKTLIESTNNMDELLIDLQNFQCNINDVIIYPHAGFVITTKLMHQNILKNVYINVCHNDVVGYLSNNKKAFRDVFLNNNNDNNKSINDLSNISNNNNNNNNEQQENIIENIDEKSRMRCPFIVNSIDAKFDDELFFKNKNNIENNNHDNTTNNNNDNNNEMILNLIKNNINSNLENNTVNIENNIIYAIVIDVVIPTTFFLMTVEDEKNDLRDDVIFKYTVYTVVIILFFV